MRHRVEADPLLLLAPVVDVAQLDADEPGDEDRDHEQPRAAGPAPDRADAGDDEHEERGRCRDHVPVEEERRVAVRRHEREEEDRCGDRDRAEGDDTAVLAHDQRDDADYRERGEEVDAPLAPARGSGSRRPTPGLPVNVRPPAFAVPTP